MAEDSQYGYATLILTNKSPQQAGLIIPNSLTSSTNLIQTSLTNWFQLYYANLRSYNAELKNLYNFGSSLFAPTATSANSPEFSTFVDNWKLLLTQLQAEIKQNDIKISGVKLEIVSPLRNLFQDDIRFSELVVNCKELQEISYDIEKQKANAEYQWNVKAPQILDNFENFKKQEKQVLFNSVLNYFQLNSTAMSNTLKSSESSVNTLLSLFNIDSEMKQYLDFLMKCEFKAVNNQYGFTAQEDSVSELKKAPAPPKHKRLSGFGGHSSNLNSHASHSELNAKQSKLKSKVGSIFGRKKNRQSRHGDQGDLETISSSNSKASKNMLRGNDGRNNSVTTATVASPLPPTPNASASGAPFQSQVPQPSASNNNRPLPPIVTSEREKEISREPLVPKPATQSHPLSVPQESRELEQTEEEPNFLTYDSGSSDNVSPVPKNGNFNKPLPIPVDNGKKYSFEVGDEAKPLQTSPKVQQHAYSFQNSRSDIFGDDHQIIDSQKANANIESDLPEPTVEVPILSEPKAAEFKENFTKDITSPLSQTPLYNHNANASASASINAPKPPPARKVAHNQTLNSFNHQQNADSVLSPEPVHVEPVKHEIMPGSFEVEEPTITASEYKSEEVPQPKSEASIPSAITGAAAGATAGVVASGIALASPSSDVASPPILPATTSSGSVPSSNFTPSVTKLTSQNTGNTLLSNHVNEFKHSGTSTQGLNISIAEMLNVSVHDDVLTTGQVLGEIVFNYEGEPDGQPLQFILKKDAFDKVMINDTILLETESADVYNINPSDILSRTIGGVKYVDELPNGQLPVTINHVWKFEEKQASLILDLKVHKPLSNVFVYAMVAPNVKTTQCLSRPSGTFSDVKNRILWRFDELKLDQRLLARFMTSGLAKEHEAGIQLRFQIPGFAYNDAKLEALDKANTHVTKNVASGSYSAHSS